MKPTHYVVFVKSFIRTIIASYIWTTSFFHVAVSVPGYVGCFNMTQGNTNTTNKLKQGNMTINLCRHFCKESDYTYAYLQEGDTCFCDNQSTRVQPKVNDANCQKPCSGNDDEVCGDKTAVSIYHGN